MRAIALALLVLVSGGALAAHPITYTPPEETIPTELAGAAGEIVVNACSACHSLEYITTQPRGKGAQFWRDEVTKMVNVYKAPIEPADAEAVAAALTAKFG